ncbi:MAG: hypothetical protein PHQ34_10435 [Methanothrix sp.]|nr:hypothetical protein [Methanothrix sp.]
MSKSLALGSDFQKLLPREVLVGAADCAGARPGGLTAVRTRGCARVSAARLTGQGSLDASGELPCSKRGPGWRLWTSLPLPDQWARQKCIS